MIDEAVVQTLTNKVNFINEEVERTGNNLADLIVCIDAEVLVHALNLIHRLQGEIGGYIADQGILLQEIKRLTKELSNVPDPFPCKVGSGCEAAGKGCYDCPNNRYRQQAVKDTAKEILCRLWNIGFEGVDKLSALENGIQEIAKEKGVEVE